MMSVGFNAKLPENNIHKIQMKLKFGKLAIHAIIIGLLVAILVLVVQGSKSGYEPSPLVVNAGPAARQTNGDIFAQSDRLDCVPGPSETADYYTVGLTPGGLCGGSAMVRDQMRDYTIADGIGGSLLEK
jgi:hypothetical protein